MKHPPWSYAAGLCLWTLAGVFAFASMDMSSASAWDGGVKEIRAAFSSDQVMAEGAGGDVLAGADHDAGEFYRASGRVIRLFRSLEKVVTRQVGRKAVTDQLAATAGTPFHFEASVSGADRQIFRAQERLTAESLAALLDVPGVDPIYINEETGSEALVTERFVVRLAPGVKRFALDALNQTHGVLVDGRMHGTDREYVCRKAGATAPEILTLCESYHQDASIEWASPDFIFELQWYYTPADPLYANQWHLHNTGQSGATPDADVDAAEAWDHPDVPQGGSPDVTIAIIDTGVDIDHEDLDDNIFVNTAEANGTPGVDDDGNGYIDDVSGWDFYHNDSDARPGVDPHGTACAGVAAAEEGNGVGGVGVAFNCSILPVKIASDSGLFGSSTQISDGIRYAADMADVLSNSWGGGGDDSVIHSAIQYATNTQGKVVLFATGNDADGTNYSPAWIRYTLTGFTAGTYTFRWEYLKNPNSSDGDDTVWLDEIVFPGGSIAESFEGSFPPAGWTTGGDASWTQYSESRHVRGTGCQSARAGVVDDRDSTYLETTQTVGAGDLVFYAWVSSEAGSDGMQMSVDGTVYFTRSGVPTVIYDVGYPALYSECMAIGASTAADIRSAYSQFDDTLVDVLDVVAPSSGGNWAITTTDITGSGGYSSGNYTSGFGGTSSATPLAAGIAALVLSKNPDLTPSEVEGILESSADEIGCDPYSGHYNEYYGQGRVNAAAALLATFMDCNNNGVPDDQDISGGTSDDCNANGIPDECDPDADGDGVPDDCDICAGFDDSLDADGDGVFVRVSTIASMPTVTACRMAVIFVSVTMPQATVTATAFATIPIRATSRC